MRGRSRTAPNREAQLEAVLQAALYLLGARQDRMLTIEEWTDLARAVGLRELVSALRTGLVARRNQGLAVRALLGGRVAVAAIVGGDADRVDGAVALMRTRDWAKVRVAGSIDRVGMGPDLPGMARKPRGATGPEGCPPGRGWTTGAGLSSPTGEVSREARGRESLARLDLSGTLQMLGPRVVQKVADVAERFA